MRKKSIFIDWSVIENQFNIVFYNKNIYYKKCILLKKITGWIDLQYKIINTKYLNIAIAFHQTRARARDCSKKWRLQYISQWTCRTSFFILNILENNLYQFRCLIAIIYMRLWVFKRHFSTIFQLYIDHWATFPGPNMVQGKNTLGYLRNRTFYIPERKYAYKYASITKCLTCSPWDM